MNTKYIIPRWYNACYKDYNAISHYKQFIQHFNISLIWTAPRRVSTAAGSAPRRGQHRGGVSTAAGQHRGGSAPRRVHPARCERKSKVDECNDGRSGVKRSSMSEIILEMSLILFMISLIQFNSVQFISIPFNSIQFNSNQLVYCCNDERKRNSFRDVSD